MRIRQATTYDLLCVLALLQYFIEVLHGYKWKKEWILKALYNIRNHHSQNEDLWTIIINVCNKHAVFAEKHTLLSIIGDFQLQVDNQLQEMSKY